MLLDVNISSTPISHFYINIKKYLNEVILLKELDVVKKRNNCLNLSIDGYFIDEEGDEEIDLTIKKHIKIALEESCGDVSNVSVDLRGMLRNSIIFEEDG